MTLNFGEKNDLHPILHSSSMQISPASHSASVLQPRYTNITYSTYSLVGLFKLNSFSAIYMENKDDYKGYLEKEMCKILSRFGRNGMGRASFHCFFEKKSTAPK